jgi:peptide/nickel transport system permease protein
MTAPVSASASAPTPADAAASAAPGPGTGPVALEVLSPSREAWRVFRRNKAAMLGLVLLSGVILAMVLGPTLYPVPAFDISGAPFTEPFMTLSLPLGSDYLGRDILAGMAVGGRATLLVGLAAAAITVSIGLTVGALAGYFGGWVDEALSRLTEIFQVMPSLLFAMVLMTLFDPSLTTAIVAIGMVTWTSTARLARAEFMRLRKLEYVSAARALGAGPLRLMLREILPNAAPPLIVSATLIIGVAILFEAGLSFLGLSDPNVMSWGLMIGANRKYVLDAWWAVTFPGLAIFTTVLAVSLVGDGLNDALNPKMHQR